MEFLIKSETYNSWILKTEVTLKDPDLIEFFTFF